MRSNRPIRGPPNADGAIWTIPGTPRGVSRRAGPGPCGTAPGSAVPGSTRISAAGRSPSVARPRGPSSVSESRDSLRASTVTAAPGVSALASRYERSPASSSASSVIRSTVAFEPDSSSDSGMPAGRRRAVSRSIGLPWGQVSGWPRSSSSFDSTRGDSAPWSRIASTSLSAQVSPTTEVRSHSSSACRRKIASAAARPEAVSDRPRPVAGSTRPSAASLRHISLAAWVVTPTWRPSCAVVATRPSEPITRSASRYSCAAAEMSAGS